MYIRHMNGRTGRAIQNQVLIYDTDSTVFLSYGTPIAKRQFESGKMVVLLDKENWDYSKTTGKYRNIFLGETRKETERKIKTGEYKLIDLNRKETLK